MTVRRPPTRVGGARSFVGSVMLAACSSGSDEPVAAAVTSSSPPPTSGAPDTTAASVEGLPDECSGLVTLRQIDEALGAPLRGEARVTVGTAEPGIVRTGRTTCGLGVVPASADAGVADRRL